MALGWYLFVGYSVLTLLGTVLVYAACVAAKRADAAAGVLVLSQQAISMQHSNRNKRRVHSGRTVWRRSVLLLIVALLLANGLSTGASAQQPDCTNLIADSSLETGSGWTMATNGSYALLSDYLVRSGARAAHLAGVDNANDQLSLSLNLPAAPQTITLNFWRQIHSEEESNEFDGLTVLVADATGHALRSLLVLGSNSATNQWQQSAADLSEFAGQSIQLQFAVRTDGTLATDFFIDDVEVTACAASQNFQLFLPMVDR